MSAASGSRSVPCAVALAFVTSIHHEGAAALRLIRDHRVEHLYRILTLMLPVMRAPGYDKESIHQARSMVGSAL